MITKEKLEWALKQNSSVCWNSSVCAYCECENVRVCDVVVIPNNESGYFNFKGTPMEKVFHGNGVVVEFECERGCEYVGVISFHKGSLFENMFLQKAGSLGPSSFLMERERGEVEDA